MTVWVFGNPDLPADALPIRLLPELRRRYPEHTFVIQDPLEEWDVPQHLCILDTVKGISAVTEFNTLDVFADSPRVTMHDYDLGTTLKWLRKLGKLPHVRIIGIPPNAEEAKTLRDLEPILKAL